MPIAAKPCRRQHGQFRAAQFAGARRQALPVPARRHRSRARRQSRHGHRALQPAHRPDRHPAHGGRRTGARREHRRRLRHPGRDSRRPRRRFGRGSRRHIERRGRRGSRSIRTRPEHLGTGTSVSNYDPLHQYRPPMSITPPSSCPTPSSTACQSIHLNTILANFSYSEAFPTGGSIQAIWNNNRETFNSPNNAFNPQFSSFVSFMRSSSCWPVSASAPTCAFCISPHQPEGFRHRLPRAGDRHRHADLQSLLGSGAAYDNAQVKRAFGRLCVARR
jgi:hypothetical protein